MLAGRSFQIRSLLGVNEHFSDKPDDADDPLSQERTQFLVRRVSDLVICRSFQIRSLLGVNEEFENKQSAEDDPLSQEIIWSRDTLLHT